MAKSPKTTSKSSGKASKPELIPLDEHLAALLNPALTQTRQAEASARAQRESGRSEGFGEAPQAAYSVEGSQQTNITMADIALKKALRIAEATPEGPRRGDRIRYRKPRAASVKAMSKKTKTSSTTKPLPVQAQP